MQGFNRQRQSNSRGSHGRNPFSRGGGNGGGRRGVKYLNPNLFIKKASGVSVEPDSISTATFTDYAIDAKIKRNIAEHGYTIPTPIQEKAIPEILAGRDVIGIANTGTGKTAAFLISLINKCMLDHNQRVLIVVPTRELACQIRDEFYIFGRGTGLEVAAVIGGANMQRQAYALHRNPHFVIGTPGRLTDLVDRRILNLNLFGNVILDEVDRMVDIGFIKDIQYLVSFLPKVRQSLFFSATVDGRTQEILKEFVKNPVTVSVKQQSNVENIDQDIVRTGGKVKIEVLHDLLIKPGFDKVIIFGRTKWGMDKLSHALIDRGFKTAIIHGNKSQGQRQRALSEFKNDQRNILIATDVAARGIDIEGVTHVINYDAPESIDDYIHRIGRTGRAGKRGVALTFVD